MRLPPEREMDVRLPPRYGETIEAADGLVESSTDACTATSRTTNGQQRR